MSPIKSRIRTVENFPKAGIMFRDITTLIKDPVGLKLCIEDFAKRYKEIEFDYVVGIDSRGFILGGALALVLGKGFIPVRKKGKLPAETISETYDLEYGTDTLEIHKDSLNKGDKVIIIDDLIATAGTMKATINLVKKIGGDILECAVVVELPDLNGRKKIEELGCKLYSSTQFEGD